MTDNIGLTSDYGTGGLFTNPLIPVEKDIVKIMVRATVAGEMPDEITANLSIAAPNGETQQYQVQLVPQDGQATGSTEWQAQKNGRYTVTAKLGPDKTDDETNEDKNVASIELPVVIPGRKPHFPWFGEVRHLRWATAWAGGFDKEMTAHWQKRGVMPLAWKWGTNLQGEWDEEKVYEMNCEFGDASGVAVDECGYYPKPEAHERFATYLRGIMRAKEENPDAFFLMWHAGSLYPEQASLYRGACDLVVLESYVFHWGPEGLGTENFYDFLDMKMLPARQTDLLVPTGSGTQVITSVDLTYPTFHRGMMENIVRHLRRTWPEMRGIGFYGSCTRDATEQQMCEGIANNKFVDQLCHDYFIIPVVTILPGNLWICRQDDGRYLVTAAVSNIGGMDSGPVTVSIYADDELLKGIQLEQIPAGNNLKENQVRVEASWTPSSGAHKLKVHLGPAPGSTVLDGEATADYYVQ